MKVLVIDIGGTYIKYALMDESFTINHKNKVKTPKDSKDSLIATIKSLYDNFDEVDGIAISMPGIIDSNTGYCYMGGALSYNNEFHLKKALYEACKTIIHIENDAKCAAMAEASLGALKDCNDGFVLIFGTMIGGAFIKDHKLHKGKHFSAGEVSYVNTLRDEIPGRDHIWGNRCSVDRLCKLYADKKQLDLNTIDGICLFNAIKENDLDAIEALDIYTREIAIQIFNLQTVLDVERFAIGGGISAQEIFIEYIKKNLDILYQESLFKIPPTEIVCCQYQNDANLIGALKCFIDEESIA